MKYYKIKIRETYNYQSTRIQNGIKHGMTQKSSRIIQEISVVASERPRHTAYVITLCNQISRAAREINELYVKGGDNGYFFVKLDFEIAVDQQTRTSDRTFEGVPDPNRQTVPAGQPRPYLVQIRPNLAKYPEHAQNPYFMCSTCS